MVDSIETAEAIVEDINNGKLLKEVEDFDYQFNKVIKMKGKTINEYELD
jgi:hypothetical protein